MTTNAAADRTVFVLGVTQRTGTHFLETVLGAHPDCVPLGPPLVNSRLDFEDFLLERADLLDDYVSSTQRLWNTGGYGDDGGIGDRLRAALGSSLLDTFESLLPPASQGKRLLARTPRIGHLELLPKLFPGSKAIVIVRDPRAVVESAVRSFGRVHRSTRPAWEPWAERWAQGVRDFVRCSKDLSCLQLQGVRFEDLHSRRREMTERLLDFLALDRDAYPFDDLDDLPVVGSSTLADSDGGVHWDRAVSPTQVDVDQRGQGWSDADEARLAQIAGEEMRAMGYAVGPSGSRRIRARGELANTIRAAELMARRTLGR